MVCAKSPFQLLLQQAAQGVSRAWAILDERFGPDLLAALSRRLKKLPRLCRVCQVDDVAQEVWLSLFQKKTLGKKRFDTPEALTAYLARAGRNRVFNLAWRYLGARRRKIAREQSLDAPGGIEEAGGCVSNAPGPERVAAAKEEWEQVLDRQSEAHRRVVELRGQEWTIPAITEEVGMSGSSVNRILAAARAEQ